MSQPAPYREPEEPPPRSATELVDRLGALRSTHPGPSLLVALLPAIAAAVLVIVIGASLATNVGAGVFAIVLPFAVMLFMLLGWDPLRRGRYVVALHQQGIVVVRGSVSDEIPFADVDEVWLDLSVMSITAGLGEIALVDGVRLVDRSGRSHVVPLPKQSEVMQAILRNCTDPLLADARRAVAAGATLTFGDVAVTATTISIGGVVRGWESIRLVRFLAGRVAFFGRWWLLPWKTVRLDRVPHPTLFTTIVRERAGAVESDDGLGT